MLLFDGIRVDLPRMLFDSPFQRESCLVPCAIAQQCSGSVLPRYGMSFIPNKIWGAVNSAVPLGMNSVHNWPLAQLLALEPRVRVGTDNGIT